MLLSHWATERTRRGAPLKRSFIDVRKAYFHGVPSRNLYVGLPAGMGQGKDVVAKLERCICGCRDSGAIWETVYGDALIAMGFKQGVAWPRCFYHAACDVSMVVHGNDFTALGTAAGLDMYEAAMAAALEVKLKGRLGTEPEDLKEMRVLNRVIRVEGSTLLYEPDPRHAELLIRALAVEQANSQCTPGVKTTFEKIQGQPDPAHEDDSSYEDLIAAVRAHKKQRCTVSFGDTTVVVEAPSYYAATPKDSLLNGPLFSSSCVPVAAGCCSYTGMAPAELARVHSSTRLKPTGFGRSSILRQVLLDGAAWEMSTVATINALVKKSKTQKRIGARAARAEERLKDPTAVLVGKDATSFRAVVARANYLALDRPDVAFATKELCRSFASPTRHSVDLLKRVVRYIIGTRRLVWTFGPQTPTSVLTTSVDTEFAGCLLTRRSTSGGVACRGQHLIKHWSATQGTVSLSSAEAELHGICNGASTSLGLVAVARDLGMTWGIKLQTDANAAIGICRRRGLGKIRHLATSDLWIQDRLRAGDFTLVKIAGEQHVANILTKHVDRRTLSRHVTALGMRLEEGRASSAPTLDHHAGQLQPGISQKAMLCT